VIRAWVDLWRDEEPPWILALVRILVAIVILWDFAQIAHLDLVVPLFAPAEAGGFGDVMGKAPPPEAYAWLGATATTARILHATVCVSAFTLGIGLLTRASALVLLLAYAQLAQALPLGDRGIDMMLRNCVFLLMLSGCGRTWSVDARLFGKAERVPSWPRHLLVLQLAVMYFTAGIQKTAVSWTPLGGFTALYIILQDPSIARWHFGWLQHVLPLTQLAAASTMVFEWTAGLLPLAYWYRRTRERPGWLRAQVNRYPVVGMWMTLGVALHFGIAATMALGIFPWAMLSFYPAFFHPDEAAWWLRRLRRLVPGRRAPLFAGA
jgi:hypothetical protein